MMNELIAAARRLEIEELDRAASKHGASVNSPHEGYAVIKEECEEAEDQVDAVIQKIAAFWSQVKVDCSAEEMTETLLDIEKSALLGACELIQTAAMAKKTMAGLKKEEE